MHALNSAKAVKDFRKYLPADRQWLGGLNGQAASGPQGGAGLVVTDIRPAQDASGRA